MLRKYSLLSDTELDSIVSEITPLFPRSGEKTISGIFKSRGILIQHERVRESLRRVDTSGVRERCRSVLHCRKYSVSSSNALWHLDGYHKLIRWRYVIHGAIDGYSRLITFISITGRSTHNQRIEHLYGGISLPVCASELGNVIGSVHIYIYVCVQKKIVIE